MIGGKKSKKRVSRKSCKGMKRKSCKSRRNSKRCSWRKKSKRSKGNCVRKSRRSHKGGKKRRSRKSKKRRSRKSKKRRSRKSKKRRSRKSRKHRGGNAPCPTKEQREIYCNKNDYTQALKDKPDKFTQLSAKFSCDANKCGKPGAGAGVPCATKDQRDVYCNGNDYTQALKDKPDRFKTLSAKFSCDANKCTKSKGGFDFWGMF